MGESTTDMVFAGHDLIAENGVILAESRKFTTGLTISEIDVQRLSFERRRFTTFPSSAGEGYLQVPFSLDIHPTQLTRPVSSRPLFPPTKLSGKAVVRISSPSKPTDCSKGWTIPAKTAVVGVSGRLDSALALLVAIRAMDLAGRPRTDIVAATMPCFGTRLGPRQCRNPLRTTGGDPAHHRHRWRCGPSFCRYW